MIPPRITDRARSVRAVEHIGVVVPAHNEAQGLGPCLAALERAARHPALGDVTVEVLVVLDSCADGSGDAVARTGLARVGVVSVGHRNVGRSRRHGFARLLDDAERPERLWLASTDADSSVPPDWLVRQLEWQRQGAQAVAGTVKVDDWTGHDDEVRQRFKEHQQLLGMGHGHGHVHGTNLGFRGDAYDAVGGMPAIGLAEDHALWSALTEDDRPVVSAGDLCVTTSARRDGRAPGGFSSFVKSL